MISRVHFKYADGSEFIGHGVGNPGALADGAYDAGAIGVVVIPEQS